jgi:hypothetical protein
MRILTVILIAALPAGCGNRASTDTRGILDRLASLPDENGNGLADIPSPDGVDGGEAVGIYLANDITRPEAEALAQVEIPDAVGTLVDVRADLTVDLEYGDDIQDRLRGSRPIGPFQIAAEAECPVLVNVRVGLVAEVPIVGDQPIRTFGPFRFERDAPGGFECGSVIAVETTLNDDGVPVAQTGVEPLEMFSLIE